MGKIQTKIQTLQQFIKSDIWIVKLNRLPKYKSFLIRSLRIILLALKGYKEDKVQLRASALTFYSVLSIVPVFALVFGIAKGFGLDGIMRKQLGKSLAGQEEIMEKIIEFSDSMLKNTQGGTIAGIGLIVLFWSVIKLLNNIEDSMNDIWEVKKARSFSRKFSDYLSMILIAPVLVILSSGATVFIATLKDATKSIEILELLGPFFVILIKFTPYTLIWMLFIALYVIMPNTKINVKSAIIAGIVAGTSYQLTQWGYINFQVGVSRYSAIYGSFAAVPLFFVWVQLSWLIVLFGGEIAFAIQNVSTFEFKNKDFNITHSFKELLAVFVAHSIVKNFAKGKSPQSINQLSKNLDIPARFVREIIEELVEGSVLSKIQPIKGNIFTYQPGIDTDYLTIKYILDIINNRGVKNINVSVSKDLSELSSYLTTFNKTIENSEANKLLKDI